jgi:flagellum-specific peptidoglycan hydrolase FlgJ
MSDQIGLGKRNNFGKVLDLQKVINKNLHCVPSNTPLEEDGIYGQKTKNAFESYRKTVLEHSSESILKDNGEINSEGDSWRSLLITQRKDYPKNVEKFIYFVLPPAKKVKSKYGVPISVLIAQAALESGWGKSVKGNAYFGIKSHGSKNAAVSFRTSEFVKGKKVSIQDDFRAYKSINEAAEDYGQFLSTNNRYKSAFNVKDKPLKFVQEIASAGYATDPQYASKLTSIIKKYDLILFDNPSKTVLDCKNALSNAKNTIK